MNNLPDDHLKLFTQSTMTDIDTTQFENEVKKGSDSDDERTLVRYILMILLELDNGSDVFRHHVSAEFSEANVLFWRECHKFKHLAKRGETQRNLRKHALNIYSQFVDPKTAQFPVAIPEKVVSRLKKKLDDPNAQQHTLFIEAASEIENLMASAEFPNFAKKIQETVAESWRIATSKLSITEIGKIMYMNWFMQCPEVMPMFKGDMAKNGAMVVTMVDNAINLLDDLKKLIPKLINLGKKHVKYGATPEYFAGLGKALVQTLEETLEEDWNQQMKLAWETVFNMMSSVMMHSMERSGDTKSETGSTGSKGSKMSHFMMKSGLPLILEMEFKHEIMKGELVYYYKEEHIKFWREVYEFRESALDAENDEKKLRQINAKAKSLFATYLASNAQFPLKLAVGIKQEISNKIQKDNIQATLFDEAWERVEQMMEERPFPRFSQKVGMNIQQPWDDLTEKLSTEKIGKILFMNFFMRAPEVMPMFNRDIEKHSIMLVGMVDMAIASIGDLKALLPSLLQLGEKHRNFGTIKPEYFDSLCNAFVDTLKESLKNTFSQDMEKAWRVVFLFMSQVMLNAMRRLELEESEKVSQKSGSLKTSSAKETVKSPDSAKDPVRRLKEEDTSDTGSNISDESGGSNKKKKVAQGNCLVM